MSPRFFVLTLILMSVIVPVVSATTVNLPASITSDGYVAAWTGGTYTGIRGASGAEASTATYANYARLTATATTNQYDEFYRAVLVFNKSVLVGKTINSVTLVTKSSSKNNGLGSFSYGITGFSLTNSDGTFVAGDYQRFYNERWADTDIAYADLQIGGAFNNWTGNALFKSNLSASGTWIGVMVRDVPDITNNESLITWASGATSRYAFEDAGDGTAPYLVVDYTDGSAPVSAFAANVTSGVTPLPVGFTDSSTNTPTNWDWYWSGDEIKDSDDQNPSVSLTTGLYNVRLYASNAFGGDWENKTAYINVTSGVVAPVAAFSANQTTGNTPLPVGFTDSSTNTPTAWAWYFWNNETVSSTSQNPTISLTTGTYNIRLNASNAAGYDWENKTSYISVTNPIDDPWGGYTPPSLSGTAPLNVTFNSSISYGSPTSYMWNMSDVEGDNVPITFSLVANPTYTFYAGNWSIQLTVTNADGTATTPANATFVNVTGTGSPPVANFTSNPLDTAVEGQTVYLTDTSTGSPTSWLWEWYPSGRSEVGWTTWGTTQNISFMASMVNNLGLYPGRYTIRLTATNDAGSSSVTKNYQATEAPESPIANFTPQGTYNASIEGNYLIAITNNTNVQFNDTSTGTPTSWNWTFGGAYAGTIYSSEQNPIIPFNLTAFSPGPNIVILNASNDAGSSFIIRYFTVGLPPVTPIAYLTAHNNNTGEQLTVTEGTASTARLNVTLGDRIFFHGNKSLNSPTAYNVTIAAGNGSTYIYNDADGITIPPAGFIYTNTPAGNYSVTLTVSNDVGSSVLTVPSLIRILDTTPPASVSGITNTTGVTAIQWNWINPTTSDFNYTMVWRNDTFLGNVTGTGTYWTGLTPETPYLIATKTVDIVGNVNASFVNGTATTNATMWNITASGNWVCPIDVTSVTVKMVGGGGSGAGTYTRTTAPAWSYSGLGGAAGEYTTHSNIDVSPGLTYPIVIGLRGENKSSSTVSASAASGNAGTATTAFGHTVAGGIGGLNRYPNTSADGGNGAEGVFSTVRMALNGTSDSGTGGISGLGYGAGGAGAGAYDDDANATIGGYGAGGYVQIIVYGYASENMPDFVADTTTGSAGTLIHFTDLSVLTDTSGVLYNWSFGDGGYSDVIGNTQHVYSYYGSFDVALTITSGNGSVTELKPTYINIYNKGQTISTYAPWMVRLRIVDAFGVPLPGANIAVSYIASSLPSSDATFLSQAFNVDPIVAAQMVGGDMAMSGTTTDDGSATFLMFPVLSYGLTITNETAGLNNYRVLSPKDQDYIIRCPLSDQHAPNDTLTQVTTSQNLFYLLNTSYYNLSMIYQDANGYTTNVRFQVYDYTAGNVLVYDHDLGNPGTSIITDNYTVYLPLGQEYRWGYNATKV